MARSTPLIGTRSASAGSPTGAAGRTTDAAPAAVNAVKGAGWCAVAAAAEAASTSRRRMIPPGPLPASVVRSRPRSRASRRTSGEITFGAAATPAAGPGTDETAGPSADETAGAGTDDTAGATAEGAAGDTAARPAAVRPRRRRRDEPSVVPYPTSTFPDPPWSAAGAAGAAGRE